jgi:hypothetical protein
MTTPQTATQKTERRTVADRLAEFGPTARARWSPFFDARRVSYPPARAAFAAFKQERVLEVYAAGHGQELRFIRWYPILAASGASGPKLREGDRQVPEGIYAVESLNPNSRYHVSLRIGYPNEFDRRQAQIRQRTNLGGDIMIHGGASSVGCLAMGDEAAEDLFVLAAECGIANIEIILSPCDFRRGAEPPARADLPAWIGELYDSLRTRLAALPPEA